MRLLSEQRAGSILRWLRYGAFLRSTISIPRRMLSTIMALAARGPRPAVAVRGRQALPFSARRLATRRDA
jgi:hypothetical protein